MDRHFSVRTSPMPGASRIVVLAMMAAATLSPCSSAGAQTRSARDTTTAYGARLNARGEPANLNPNRINDRVNSRLDTRLSLRVERYRPESSNDPAAAFAVQPTDNVRVGTDTTLAPLATTSSPSASQPYRASPQAGGDTRPR